MCLTAGFVFSRLCRLSLFLVGSSTLLLHVERTSSGDS